MPRSCIAARGLDDGVPPLRWSCSWMSTEAVTL